MARFETALAQLEGTAEAVAFASGMAALTAALLAATRDGKRHIVAVRPLYGGTDHVLATGLLGTEVTWATPADVAAAIRPDTALVLVETPANPSLDLVDIAALAEAAGDVPLLVDNTVATPVLQQPARHGAALVLHSATKSIGGHGDVLAGVIACAPEWAARLRQVRAVTGAVLHPLGAYLLHRGIQTLPLRVRAQQAGAEKLAAWLAGHPAVERVHHPSLHDPAGLVGRQMSGTGSLLAFEVRGGAPAAAEVAGACELITHAVSLGGVDTLIQHPASLTHRPVEGDAKPLRRAAARLGRPGGPGGPAGGSRPGAGADLTRAGRPRRRPVTTSGRRAGRGRPLPPGGPPTASCGGSSARRCRAGRAPTDRGP